MARPDPRVDPSSLPPAPAKAPPDRSVERLVVTGITAPTTLDGTAESGVVAVSPPVPTSVTSADPRVAELEPIVALNDWKTVASKLGALEQAGTLPPNLGLVAAVAGNEAAKDGDAAARELAIRCMAAVLGMPADSEIVRVLARRLLRKNPVRFRERPAPPAKTSAVIVVVALAAAVALGWFLSSSAFSRLFGH